MFACIAIKPLNDSTYGCRFNLLGLKGLTRRRKFKSRGIKFQALNSMVALHFFKRTIYLEKKANRTTSRRVRHFAG
jgi:hypothetical protein